MKSKRTIVSVIGLIFVGQMLAPAKDKPSTDRSLRDKYHAHYYYTAAVAIDDDNRGMELLNAAIALAPDMARALFNRGVLHVKRGDLASSRSDFEHAAQSNPDLIYAHYNLACVNSLGGKLDDGLKNLESALAKGYRKFDKLPLDPDLKNLRAAPGYAALIAKYQASAATTPLTPYQKLQTVPVLEKLEVLADAIRNPGDDAGTLAQYALSDAAFEPRVLSMELWRKLNVPQTKPALILGLYDTNGYVSKAAANALIAYGKDVEELVAATLDDNRTPAPLFAMQILAAVGAKDSSNKIAAYLLDEDYRLRLTAAKCLAGLAAVAALPQVEVAAKQLPDEEAARNYYQLEFQIAIGQLKKLAKK